MILLLSSLTSFLLRSTLLTPAALLCNIQFSTKALQRECAIGYYKALQIVDRLEAEGIIGPATAKVNREILVDLSGE